MAGDATTGSGTLFAAAQWLMGITQGPLAVSLAVVAIAATGFLMLSGRLALRRGLAVAVGCFILFGASTIATGIIKSASAFADTESLETPTLTPNSTVAPHAPQQSVPASPYDPYAGASVKT